VEHRSGYALDDALGLLDPIVEILDLTNLDRHVPILIDAIDGGFMGATFAHRGLPGLLVTAPRLFEEPRGGCLIALCRQAKVDGFTGLITGPLAIFPDAFHLKAGLVHSPAPPNRGACAGGKLFQAPAKSGSPSA
jgi:hypothetical protein